MTAGSAGPKSPQRTRWHHGGKPPFTLIELHLDGIVYNLGTPSGHPTLTAGALPASSAFRVWIPGTQVVAVVALLVARIIRARLRAARKR